VIGRIESVDLTSTDQQWSPQGSLHLCNPYSRTSEPSLWSFGFREVDSLLVRSRSLLSNAATEAAGLRLFTWNFFGASALWLGKRQEQLGLSGLAISSLLNTVNIAAGLEGSGSVGRLTQTISPGHSDQDIHAGQGPSPERQAGAQRCVVR